MKSSNICICPDKTRLKKSQHLTAETEINNQLCIVRHFLSFRMLENTPRPKLNGLK